MLRLPPLPITLALYLNGALPPVLVCHQLRATTVLRLRWAHYRARCLHACANPRLARLGAALAYVCMLDACGGARYWQHHAMRGAHPAMRQGAAVAIRLVRMGAPLYTIG